MIRDMEYRKQGHCVYGIEYHILLKSNTGQAMREKFPFLTDVYWGEDGIWSGGDFVSTVGLNEEMIKRYIELQGRENVGQAKLEF